MVRRRCLLGFALIALGCWPALAAAQSWDLDVYKIGERRHLAEAKVGRLKSKITDPAKLKPVEQAYTAAMAKHGAWFDLVAAAIIEKRKKLDTPEYRQIVDETAKSFAAFDSAANDLLDPKSPSMYRVDAVTSGIVGEIIGELIKGGIAFWKAHKELEDARRKQAVDFLAGRAQWPPWAAIGACGAQ
jgi:hypothetical protein